jgi:hypothetical protein
MGWDFFLFHHIHGSSRKETGSPRACGQASDRHIPNGEWFANLEEITRLSRDSWRQSRNLEIISRLSRDYHELFTTNLEIISRFSRLISRLSRELFGDLNHIRKALPAR